MSDGLAGDDPGMNETVRQIELPDGRRVWSVSRYRQARAVLSDPRLTNDWSRMGAKAPFASLPTEAVSIMARDLLSADPPQHTRLRRLVAPAFSTRAVAEVRPAVERIAGELLDKVRGRAEVDLVADYTMLLPTLVLGEIFGIPAADCRDVQYWSDIFASGLLPVSDRLQTAIKWMNDYALELIRRKRVEPDDGLISRLTTELNDEELSSMVFVLLIAGQTATTQLIVKGMRLLLTHEDELARLRADPTLLPTAIEEFLRYDPPLRITAFRMTTEPIDIDGTTIPAGDIVMCSLTDANHDKARFPAPDQPDICRRDNQHLAFGHGIHRCLGASLAKLEAEVAIGALLDRYDHIELAVPADELTWSEAGIMTQLDALPVRLATAVPSGTRH